MIEPTWLYTVEYGGYKAIEALNNTGHNAAFNPLQKAYLNQFAEEKRSSMQRKKQVDARLPDNPDELLNDPNWEETSHPGAKEKGHRTFENKETGEKLRHDAAKPGATGHKGESHWHRHNPDSTGDIDKYLDAKGNPVSDGHPDSHLYPRQGVDI